MRPVALRPTRTRVVDAYGQTIRIHPPERCGGPCPFHAPSRHRLDRAPVIIRFDKLALVERVCEHGVGHDDPDSAAWLRSFGPQYEWAGVHGCDGCCR